MELAKGLGREPTAAFEGVTDPRFTEQSEAKAIRRESLQKQETPGSLLRNLPGETGAVEETRLLLRGLS